MNVTRATLLCKPMVKSSGTPDEGNLHVRCDEGPRGPARAAPLGLLYSELARPSCSRVAIMGFMGQAANFVVGIMASPFATANFPVVALVLPAAFLISSSVGSPMSALRVCWTLLASA